MKTLMVVVLKRMTAAALPLALLAAGIMGFGAAPALAQNAKLELSQLDKLAHKASEVNNVNLEGPMLQFAAQQMTEKANKSKSRKKLAVADMLRRMKGIYVRNYEFSQPGQYSKADLRSVMKQLESKGWKPMVHVEEKKSGETTGIYLMEEGGETVGMAIVSAEPKELTIVNLVGPINFSQLGGLGSLGALGALGGIAGSSATPHSQIPHRPSAAPKGEGDSK